MYFGGKSMKKKCIALLIVGAMLMGMLIGCKSNEKDPEPVTVKDPTTTETTPADEPTVAPVVSRIKDGKMIEPTTITTGRAINSSVLFKNGETIENNVHTKWVKDNLNINIKYDWVVSEEGGAFETKIKLLLASGDKLPDVMTIWWKSPLYSQLIESGKIMDVSEAYETYASQRTKDLYNAFPESWYTVQKDSAKWGLPILTTADGADSVLWIRTDWLENLGLSEPKTISELETVMEAFTNQDPDQNGKKDTLGLSMASKGWVGGWMADTNYLWGAVAGAFPFRWGVVEDGSLAYGSVQPKIKDALGYLKKWYDNGYIDKEIALTDENKAAENFNSGKAGIICGPYWMAGWPLPDLAKNIPGATFKAIPIPTNDNGDLKRFTGFGADYITVFSKDFENMDAYFLYYDTILGSRISDESSPLYYGLAEDYDYTMVDGKVSYIQDQIPGGYINVNKYLLSDVNTNSKASNQLPFEIRVLNNDLKTDKDKAMALGQIPEVLAAYKMVYEQNKECGVYDAYLGSDTPTMLTKRQLLEKMENEVFIQIIYGQIELDAFDKFVSDWKINGGDDITKEVNEWWQSVK